MFLFDIFDVQKQPPGCSVKKKMFLKILQYSQEKTCVGASFLKKRFQHKFFPLNIAKSLRTPAKKICELLLLDEHDNIMFSLFVEHDDCVNVSEAR